MAMVVVPARQEVEVLNAVGTQVWHLIDGQRSVGAILEQLQSEYDVDPAQLEGDVRAFIEALDEHHMLLRDGEE